MWQRKIINYGRSQYQAGFQNWMIDQSDNGKIYFANTNGLLEHDGVYWSLYPISNKIVRSVKTIGSRVYAGGSSEFGYFEPNSQGLLTYRSLSENLKDWGGEVWCIHENKGRIYFVSDAAIYIYQENTKLKFVPIYDLNTKIDCSILTNERLYIGTSNGIYYLNEKDEVTPLEHCNVLKNKKAIELLAYDNKLIAVTAQDGLYLITDDKCEIIQSVSQKFVSKNQLFCAAISDSKIILGSVRNGAFMFDLNDSNYQEEFNIQTGLGNNTVLGLYFDKDNDLWLGLDKGIGYIDLNASVRPLFAKDSPVGTGYCVSEYNGELYWGTNQGLYKVDDNDIFRLIENSQGQVWSLLEYDNALFSAGDNGILVITPSQKYKINLQGAWEVRPLAADKNKMIVSTYSGFGVLLKENNKWTFGYMVPDFFYSVRGFIEDVKDYDFWYVNATKKTIDRITIDPSLGYVHNIKEYPMEEGCETGENPYIRIIDNNLCFCTKNGIYRYDRLSDKFLHYDQLESILEGQKYYDYLSADRFNNIWYVSDGNLKYIPYVSGSYQKGKYKWDLSNELIDGYEDIYLIDSVSAIVSIDESFLRIDFSDETNKNKTTDVFIKKLILTDNDSIINYNDKTGELSFPFSLNSMNIYFGAANFKSADVLYSYMLEGLDDKWSPPSSKTQKEYTNLSEGSYVFKVKAIIRGVEQPNVIASVEFEILPPWYRSTLAYVIYIILFVALISLIIKRLNDKYKKDLILKKEELIEQKRRHEEETRIKDQEIYKLQNESLQNDLRFKTQELSGNVLNLLRKNEILEDVKKSAVGISKAIDDQKDMPAIKQRIIRLITQINNSIEHDDDFEIFKSNFDLIHKDFFKLLDERHPGLTRNDKILCAYLKMNFSSKEIAPLFNISIRGVEVNRYRLRKKMNLDRMVNLSEYLQNLSK